MLVYGHGRQEEGRGERQDGPHLAPLARLQGLQDLQVGGSAVASVSTLSGGEWGLLLAQSVQCNYTGTRQCLSG